jgi:hypothetical protein
MILCAAADGNALFEFTDTTFTSLEQYGSISIVNPGVTNEIAFYSSPNVISGLANIPNGVLATNGASVPAIVATLPLQVQSNITRLGTIAFGIWQGTPVGVSFGGTGDSSFTPFAVITGGITSTGTLQNVSGLGTTGFVLTSNGVGALPTWQVSAGSGTVNVGTANAIAYYPSNTAAVSPLTTAANATLVTSGLGVPSLSTTLPLAVQSNITQLGTQTQALNMGSNQINNVANPTSAQDAATMAYVNSVTGINQIDGVFAASTSNLTGYTYLNGAAGVGATLTAPSIGVFTQDGVSLVASQRFLYKDDSTFAGVANGVYVVTTSSGGTNAVLTRASDFDSPSDINPGDIVTVTNGTVNAGSIWVQTATVVTIGVSPIAFSIFFNPAAFVSSTLANGTIFIGNASNVATQSTTTWPVTLPINQILYTSLANTVTGLATANNSVLATSGAGVPAFTTALPSAVQVAVGSLNSGTAASSSTFWRGDGTWAAIPAPTGAALTETNDTNVTMTLGGTPTTALLQAVSLTLGWTGQLSVARGGTGLATITANNLMVGTGTSPVSLIAPSITVGIPLVSQGSSSDPAFATAVVAGGGTGVATFTPYSVITGGITSTGALQNVANVGTTGQVLTSNGPAALPTWQPSSGSGTVNTGVAQQLAYYATSTNAVSGLATLANGVLTSVSGTLTWAAQLGLTQGGTNASLIASNGGIVWSNASQLQILAGTATADQILLSGASGTPSWSTTTYPATNAINTLLFATSANTLVASTLSAVIDASIGSTQGDILYRSATAWTALTPGTSGQFLQTQGASANPQWATAGTGSGTVTNVATGTGLTGGPITTTGTIAVATNGITNALLAQMPTLTIKGNNTGSTANALDLTVGQVNTMLGGVTGKTFSINIQTFSANGTYTPTSGMVYCQVEAVGGGGGSGGLTGGGATTQYNSSGGGGGGYQSSILSAATIGASKAVAIGAGGTAGAAAAGNAGNGDDTTLGTTLVVAKGGSGSLGGFLTPGGAGGVAGTGTVFVPGQNGESAPISAAVTQAFASGAGGDSYFGRGGKGGSSNAASVGIVGTGFGAGAAGANGYNSGANFAGAAGTAGYMVITEYIFT